jgi:hypothetical protein
MMHFPCNGKKFILQCISPISIQLNDLSVHIFNVIV